MVRKIVFISISFFLLFQNVSAFPMNFYDDNYPEEVRSEEFLPPGKHYNYNHRYYPHQYPHSYEHIPPYTPDYMHHHEPYYHHHHHHHNHHHHDRFYHPMEQPYYPPVQYPVFESVENPTMEVYPSMKNQEMLHLYKLLDLMRTESNSYGGINMRVIEPQVTDRTEFGAFIPVRPIEFPSQIENGKPIDFEQIAINNPIEIHQIEVELTPVEIQTAPEIQTSLFDENLFKPTENLFQTEDLMQPDITSFDEKFNKFIESPIFKEYLDNQFSKLKEILGEDSKFKDLFEDFPKSKDTFDENSEFEINSAKDISESTDDKSISYGVNMFKLLMAPFVNIPEIAEEKEEKIKESLDEEDAESAISGLDMLMFIASKLPSKENNPNMVTPLKKVSEEENYTVTPENDEDNEIDNDWVKVVRDLDKELDEFRSAMDENDDKKIDVTGSEKKVTKTKPISLNFDAPKIPVEIHWY